jgi:hypothetical protein
MRGSASAAVTRSRTGAKEPAVAHERNLYGLLAVLALAPSAALAVPLHHVAVDVLRFAPFSNDAGKVIGQRTPGRQTRARSA